MARTAIARIPGRGGARLVGACRGGSCCAWLPRRARRPPRTLHPVDVERSLLLRPSRAPEHSGGSPGGGADSGRGSEDVSRTRWVRSCAHGSGRAHKRGHRTGEGRQQSPRSRRSRRDDSVHCHAVTREVPPAAKRARWSARDDPAAGVLIERCRARDVPSPADLRYATRGRAVREVGGSVDVVGAAGNRPWRLHLPAANPGAETPEAERAFVGGAPDLPDRPTRIRESVSAATVL